MDKLIRRVAVRLWPDRYRNWSIEVALRYLPLARQIRSAGYEHDVTEIGSGDLGITPYLRRKVVGVDRGFTRPNLLMDRLEASVLNLPFQDASQPCVLTTDMLEHLPPGVRSKAVDELVRVTRNYLVVAVPAGLRAEQQDQELDRLYERLHGSRHPFLIEHVDNGLPRLGEIDEYVRGALARSGRRAEVDYRWNTNLLLRARLMSLWIHGGVLGTGMGLMLSFLHPVLSRVNVGCCYRVVATIRFV